MIKVEIMLHSANGPSRDKKLGTILIVNDGTGTETTGNYRVQLEKNFHVIRTAHVLGFKRKRQSWIKLLHEALEELTNEGSKKPK